jgi:CheY-like chemotaxis protein
MDGATCCQAIKANPSLSCIPLVMVTSRNKDEDRDYCYSTGCDDFISKPLDRDIFLGVARRFIPDIDRREQRTKLDLASSIQVKGETVPCVVNDLSPGGAYVVTDYFGTPNEVIRISITLPGLAEIECHGRVAWVNRVSSGSLPKGLGVKFALMDKQVKATLMTFLDTLNDNKRLPEQDGK